METGSEAGRRGPEWEWGGKDGRKENAVTRTRGNALAMSISLCELLFKKLYQMQGIFLKRRHKEKTNPIKYLTS